MPSATASAGARHGRLRAGRRPRTSPWKATKSCRREKGLRAAVGRAKKDTSGQPDHDIRSVEAGSRHPRFWGSCEGEAHSRSASINIRRASWLSASEDTGATGSTSNGLALKRRYVSRLCMMAGSCTTAVAGEPRGRHGTTDQFSTKRPCTLRSASVRCARRHVRRDCRNHSQSNAFIPPASAPWRQKSEALSRRMCDSALFSWSTTCRQHALCVSIHIIQLRTSRVASRAGNRAVVAILWAHLSRNGA